MGASQVIVNPIAVERLLLTFNPRPARHSACITRSRRRREAVALNDGNASPSNKFTPFMTNKKSLRSVDSASFRRVSILQLQKRQSVH